MACLAPPCDIAILSPWHSAAIGMKAVKKPFENSLQEFTYLKMSMNKYE